MNILSLIVLPLVAIHSTSGQEEFWLMLCLLRNCHQTLTQQNSYQPIQSYTSNQAFRPEQQPYQQPTSIQQQPYQQPTSIQQQPDTIQPQEPTTIQPQETNTIQSDTTQQQAIIAQAIKNLQQVNTIENQQQSSNLLQQPDTTQQLSNLLQTPNSTQQQTQPDASNTQFDNVLQQSDTPQQLVNTDTANDPIIFTGSQLIAPQSNSVIGSPALERPPATNDVAASKFLTEIPGNQTNNEAPNLVPIQSNIINNVAPIQPIPTITEAPMEPITTIQPITPIQPRTAINEAPIQANVEASIQPSIATPIQANVMTPDSVRTFSMMPQQPQPQANSWLDDLNCYFVNGECQASNQLCFGILKKDFCAGATSSCCIPLRELMPL